MKTNFLNYSLLAFGTLNALLIFALLIAWGVSLPETALLWANGPVNGWAFLSLFATVSAVLAWLPCFMIINDIKMNNSKKH